MAEKFLVVGVVKKVTAKKTNNKEFKIIELEKVDGEEEKYFFWHRNTAIKEQSKITAEVRSSNGYNSIERFREMSDDEYNFELEMHKKAQAQEAQEAFYKQLFNEYKDIFKNIRLN